MCLFGCLCREWSACGKNGDDYYDSFNKTLKTIQFNLLELLSAQILIQVHYFLSTQDVFCSSIRGIITGMQFLL